jgi:hypothetical protein
LVGHQSFSLCIPDQYLTFLLNWLSLHGLGFPQYMSTWHNFV